MEIDLLVLRLQELDAGKNLNHGEKQMDVSKMLTDLRQEREQIEEAITSLERLASSGKRRGRPPAWITAIKKRGRPPGSKNKPKLEADGRLRLD